jgi:hypothetical protein
LEGNELQIFDHEPTSEMMSPSQKFLVCQPEGTTSILSSVPYSDVVNTAKSDLPFILKVMVANVFSLMVHLLEACLSMFLYFIVIVQINVFLGA